MRRRASTDDIRRPAPPAAIPWRQLGSIITVMRIGSQTFIARMGLSWPVETVGPPYFVAGPDRMRSTLHSPTSQSQVRHRRDCGDSPLALVEDATIDGLALTEWANAARQSAAFVSSRDPRPPLCSPIAAAAQIYRRLNESQRRPNAADKRYRDIPSCAKESADMRGRLGAISVELADQERGRP